MTIALHKVTNLGLSLRIKQLINVNLGHESYWTIHLFILGQVIETRYTDLALDWSDELIEFETRIGDLSKDSRLEFRNEETCLDLMLFDKDILRQGNQYLSENALPDGLTYLTKVIGEEDGLVMEAIKRDYHQPLLLVELPCFDCKLQYKNQCYPPPGVSKSSLENVNELHTLARVLEKPCTLALTANEKRLLQRQVNSSKLPRFNLKLLQVGLLAGNQFECHLETLLFPSVNDFDFLDHLPEIDLLPSALCDLVIKGNRPKLGDYLVERARRHPAWFGQSLHWHARVSYARSKEPLYRVMLRALPRFDLIDFQASLLDTLIQEINAVRVKKLARQQASAELCTRLHQVSHSFEKAGINLPIDPIGCRQIEALLVDDTLVYKSKAMPVRLTFLVKEEDTRPVMIKIGEDLRQDQMILRCIRLIDLIWKEAGLDLCLTPYQCLPIKPDCGILEFVPGSVTLASLIDEKGLKLPNIVNLSHFIASSAGYSLITFVLGIGDRHLENILLTPAGCLFHVDFSHAFGSDPKPFPPPMKLCREMVDAMGQPGFSRFKSLCFDAYTHLKASSGRLLAFLSLHNIPPESLQYVSDRLMLDLEQLEQLIEESIGAYSGVLIDTLHKWAQYWRS